MAEELSEIAAEVQQSPERSKPSNVGQTRKGKVALNASGAKKRGPAQETESLTPTRNEKAAKHISSKKEASVGKRVAGMLNAPERKAEYGPVSAMDELNEFIANQGKEAEPEAEETAKPAAKKESSDFPPYLVDALAERGFSQDDFKTPAAAHKFLLAAGGANQRQTAAPSATPQHEPAKAFDPFEGFDRESFETEFGDHGKKLLGVIEKIQKQHSDHIGQLAQHAVASQQALDRQHRESIDNAFESLNSDFKGAFGDGSIADLPQHSLEASNRQSVYNMARILEQDLVQTGRTVPNFRTLLKRAATTVMGTRKESAPAEEEDAEPAPKKRPKVAGGITSNGHETLSPRAGGLNAIRQFMRR